MCDTEIYDWWDIIQKQNTIVIFYTDVQTVLHQLWILWTNSIGVANGRSISVDDNP